jgi:hypothetical protein
MKQIARKKTKLLWAMKDLTWKPFKVGCSLFTVSFQKLLIFFSIGRKSAIAT